MLKELLNKIKDLVKQEQDNRLKVEGTLSARLFKLDGKIIDLGILGKKVVTTAGVNYMVDGFQNSTTSPISDFKYHDSGTGTTAEAVGDTALVTPCAEARDTGSLTEGATANIFKTVATHTYAGTFAITEHGLFSAATVGTLWDRTVFGAVNVVSGEKIEFTYQLTCTAGG